MRLRHLAAAGAAAAALTLTSVPPASADQPVAAAGPLKADRAKAKVFEDPSTTASTRSSPAACQICRPTALTASAPPKTSASAPSPSTSTSTTPAPTSP